MVGLIRSQNGCQVVFPYVTLILGEKLSHFITSIIRRRNKLFTWQENAPRQCQKNSIPNTL